MLPTKIKFEPREQLPDGQTKLTLLLQIDRKDLEIPPEVSDQAKKLNFRAKPESHLTVIGFAGSNKLNLAIDAGYLKIDDIEQIIESYQNQLEIWQTLDYFWLEKTYDNSDSDTIPPGGQLRRTIVNLVHAPAVETMLEEINNLIEPKKFKLPKPFLHITLFSFGQNLKPTLLENGVNYADPFMGIGINSEADFESCKPRKIKIEHPENY
jgi:hypothetical protein